MTFQEKELDKLTKMYGYTHHNNSNFAKIDEDCIVRIGEDWYLLPRRQK